MPFWTRLKTRLSGVFSKIKKQISFVFEPLSAFLKWTRLTLIPFIIKAIKRLLVFILKEAKIGFLFVKKEITILFKKTSKSEKIKHHLGKIKEKSLCFCAPLKGKKFKLFKGKKGGLFFQVILLGCFLGTGLAFFLAPSYDNLVRYVQVDKLTEEDKLEEPPEIILKETEPEEEELSEEELLVHPFFENLGPEEKIESFNESFKRGETLSGFLKRTADLSLKDALQVAKALDPLYPLNKIQAGQKFIIFLSNKTFLGLFLETRQGNFISVKKDASSGKIEAFTQEGKLHTERKILEGVVKNSIAETLSKHKAPPALALEVSRALKDIINMRRDLKQNGKFRIVFDETRVEFSRHAPKIRLLFISLETRQGIKELYHFKTKRGKSAYFNKYGQTGNQILMQRPLGRGRISSPFGMRRHPILKYRIFHSGIDFPARTGTPIPAGADGVIVRLGRRGGYGKQIQIKHNNMYSSLYAHMSGYASKSKVGAFVRKGQIIGYVGSTGRSTGPHLHYEIRKYKKAVNPLHTHVIIGYHLSRTDLKNFKIFAKSVNPLFRYQIPKKSTRRYQSSKKKKSYSFKKPSLKRRRAVRKSYPKKIFKVKKKIPVPKKKIPYKKRKS
ncbi:MAG: hypothetical protein EOM53_05285 [Alphaproteobacteria bacterium]|nr:hypothetical protein [Alphaproteobacteria bacterium]